MKGLRRVTSRLILVMPLRARKGPRPAFRGRSDGKRSGPATAGGGYFPPPDAASATRPAARNIHSSGFASPDKIAAARCPPLRSGRKRCRPAPPAVG
jgi:hypothetical protein